MKQKQLENMVSKAAHYLLLENYPRGLTLPELTEELLARGLPDVREKRTYEDSPELSLQLHKYSQIDQNAEKVYDLLGNRIEADVSRTIQKIIKFYSEFPLENQVPDIKSPNGLIYKAEFEIIDANSGSLSQSEELAFAYGSPIYDPRSWTYNTDLCTIGHELIIYDQALEPPQKQLQFNSENNINLSLAHWYSRNFRQPFHEIYYEAALSKKDFDCATAQIVSDRLSQMIVH